jgi:hypothetical protein
MMQLFQNANGYKRNRKNNCCWQYYSSHSKLDGNQFIKRCQSLKIIIFSPIVPLCDAETGLLINLPEVNSSPGKIYV